MVWANVAGDLMRRRSHDEVYDHSIEILPTSEGRGYFHGCSNTILPGTPPENVSAMMQARDDSAPWDADQASQIGGGRPPAARLV